MTKEHDVPDLRKLVVLGSEQVGIDSPPPIKMRNVEIYFSRLDSAERIQDFDGAIVFQGTFESFEWRDGFEPYLHHEWKQDELDRRKKEIALLEEGGGFVAVILCDSFTDENGRRNFKDTDLSKTLLNHPKISRRNFDRRTTEIQIHRDEFRSFLKHDGAATSFFQHNRDPDIDWRVVAKVGAVDVALILNQRRFFIPALLPPADQAGKERYFTQLADALISSHARIADALPQWVEEFCFVPEKAVKDVEAQVSHELLKVRDQLAVFNTFKRVLTLTGEPLVEAVQALFERGFAWKINAVDELREDLKILDEKGSPRLFCEIKGTNGNLKREYINQADSHRERAGLDSKFPTLLILNTRLKDARNFSEKDHPLPSEQVAHAHRLGILVLRTLDLLHLADLVLSNQMKSDELLKIFLMESGWLRVKGNAVETLHE